MSSQRSSSGVRNLRAVFESESESPSRGRSPTGSVGSQSNTDKSPAPPRKVRASFVAVEPRQSSTDGAPMSTTAKRRESISLSQDQDAAALSEVKKTVSNEAERRQSNPNLNENVIPENAISSAMPTPIQEIPEAAAAIGEMRTAGKSGLKEVLLPNEEKQSEHPDKTVSAVEDEEAVLQPADVKDTNTVSKGEGMPKTNGAARKSAAKTTTSRPSNTSNRTTASKPVRQSAASQQSSSSQKPANANRKRSPTRPVRLPTHLTAPTQSSAAKHEPESNDKKTVSNKTPGNLSHLMAPTASSKAKHELESTTVKEQQTASRRTSTLPKRDRTSGASSISTSSRQRPTASNRTSLARSTNGVANDNANKGPSANTASKQPPEGFLARMMRPTTSSSSKTHDRSEGDSPTNATHSKVDKSLPKVNPVMEKRQSAPRTSDKTKSDKSNASSLKSSTVTSPVSPKVPSKTREDAGMAPRQSNAQTAQHEIPASISSSHDTKEPKKTVESKPVSPLPESVQDVKSIPTGKAGEEKNQGTVTSTSGATDAEWTAAALPTTPQNREEIAANSEDLPEAGAGNVHKAPETPPNTTTNDDAQKNLRSMMETPNLEDATIH